MRVSVFALMISIGAIASTSAQAVLQVPAQFATIQAGILAAAPGDTVLVAPGTYTELIDFRGKNITLRSSAGAAVTTIDGGGMGTVATFAMGETSAALLWGFTLINGLGASGAIVSTMGPGSPGGILCDQSSPTILECIVECCTGGDGANIIVVGGIGGAGGVLCWGSSSTPIFERCSIRNNQGGTGGMGATFGLPGGGGGGGPGGMLVSMGSEPVFIDCTIENNTGGQGQMAPNEPLAFAGFGGSGAVRVDLSSPQFTNCRIACNTGGPGADPADPSGTGMPAEGGPGGAGGVDFRPAFGTSSVSLFRGCIIADNQGGAAGMSTQAGRGGVGGFRNDVTAAAGGITCLLNCTVANNLGGTGITNGVGGVDATLLTDVTNTIVWGNLAGGFGAANDAQGSMVISSSLVDGGFGGSLDMDPLFVDPANGDYHVAFDSPCVDAGDDSAMNLAMVDFDGDVRIVNGAPDIGADETCLEGTDDDFLLETQINGAGDPTACVKTASSGNTLSLTFSSPGGTLVGELAVLGASLRLSGPTASTLIDGLWVSPVNGFLVVGGSSLPPSGISRMFLMPSGLSGITGRLQAVAVSPMTTNGIFGTTRAHDIVF